MPVGEVVTEIVGQMVLEAGGEAIRHQFGWIGCVVAGAAGLGSIALLFWLID